MYVIHISMISIFLFTFASIIHMAIHDISMIISVYILYTRLLRGVQLAQTLLSAASDEEKKEIERRQRLKEEGDDTVEETRTVMIYL